MLDIRIADNLWATSLLPEGRLERWRVEDGQIVRLGEVLAEVRLEDALHDILSPAAGRARRIAGVGDVIEPGSLLARLEIGAA